MSNLEQTRSWLKPFPETLGAFDYCIGKLIQQDGLAVAVTGSLATGELDRFSDLDLILLIQEPLTLDGFQEQLERMVTAIGKPLAHFRATHLNLPNLQVFYLDVKSWVVKMDIETYLVKKDYALPEKLLVLHDPLRLFKPSEPVQTRNTVDFAALQQKFCGWLWFSFTKIQRGEFFQAARSIDYTRENALLPCLMLLQGLPQDGHRRLETRLNQNDLARLYHSYPAKLDKDELMRSLLEVADHFMSLQDKMLHTAPQTKRADLDRMLAIIKHHQNRL